MIVSPDSMNLSRLKTIIIAPMTSTLRESFPTRVSTIFQNKEGQIALDQLRAIDRVRIVKKLGVIDTDTTNNVLRILSVLFQF